MDVIRAKERENFLEIKGRRMAYSDEGEGGSIAGTRIGQLF